MQKKNFFYYCLLLSIPFFSCGMEKTIPVGLTNCGNNCYFNASIQALYAIDQFRETLVNLDPNPFKSLSPGAKAPYTEIEINEAHKKIVEIDRDIHKDYADLPRSLTELQRLIDAKNRELSISALDAQKTALRNELTILTKYQSMLNEKATYQKKLNTNLIFYKELIPHALIELFKIMHNQQTDHIEEKRQLLLHYCQQCIGISSFSSPKEQQDASELLGIIFSALENEITQLTDASVKKILDVFFPITKINAIEQTSSSILFPCYVLQNDGSPFLMLGDTIVQALTEYDRYSFKKILPFIGFDLKRFSGTTKLFDALAIPSKLDLKSFIEQDSDKDYELKSIIVHRGGSPRAGHYICYALYDNTWYLCDDSRISEVKHLDPNGTPIEIEEGYAFFYEYPQNIIPPITSLKQLAIDLNKLNATLKEISRLLR